MRLDLGKIEQVCADLDSCHAPGAAIGVAHRGRPIFRKGFGRAHLELPIALTPSTRVRIGSTTKHFTCLAFMLMCEEGQARPDDPVGRFLPQLHPVARAVTMRELMGNVSGLRDPYDICLQFSGMSGGVTDADLLSFYRDIDDTNAPPGEAWIYNNGGWLLLTAVLEKLDDRPLEDVLRARIFEPAGMHATLLRRRDTDFVPNSATPHVMGKDGRFQKSYWMEFSGAGGMASTVDDMLRWIAHLDAPVVGSAQTWAAMKTPLRLRNGCSTGYGLGLTLGGHRGFETLHHAGSWIGGTAQMLKVPALQLDVVVLANSRAVSASLLALRIVDACVGASDRSDMPAPGKTSGVFSAAGCGRVVQLFVQNGQQFASVNGLDLPLEMDAAGRLRPAGTLAFLQQSIELRGDFAQPDSILFTEFGHSAELARVPAGTEQIAGNYLHEATRQHVAIEAGTMRCHGRFGSTTYELQRLGEATWRARSPQAVVPPGGVLRFTQDGFLFSTSQTWSLPFRRV
jgi:D-aminopeptidase